MSSLPYPMSIKIKHRENFMINCNNLSPAPNNPARKIPESPGRRHLLAIYVTKAAISLSSMRGTPLGWQPVVTHVAYAARPQYTHKEIVTIDPIPNMIIALKLQMSNY